ncbi:MAG TPA: sulfotransferase domain-containing protein [Solirubrobacteraceae bacterium]|jgi:hypothetical protein
MKNTLDFIIIGAQKSATTTLFEYLRLHPELHLPPHKELPFFSDEATRARGWDDYISNAFTFADPHAKWGTATPHYMVGGLLKEPNPQAGDGTYDELTVPLRIQERLPAVRLIAILRDPAERAQSHHRMAVMNQIDKRTFAQAIDELLQPDALEQARREPSENTGYIVWGEYGRILAAYFDVFPREQILVLFTKDLENDPERLLGRIYEFVGVRDFIPNNIGTRYRIGSTERRLSWLTYYSRVSPWALRRALVRNLTARKLWHTVPKTVRGQVDGMLVRLAHKIDLWNRRIETEVPVPDSATLERLRAHYTQDTQKLAELIGANPPWQS